VNRENSASPPYHFCDTTVFAWEDKFKRLLLRFERISKLHYALKTLAYTMINLRHFCQS
jgi:tmRNA-binding protein